MGHIFFLYILLALIFLIFFFLSFYRFSEKHQTTKFQRVYLSNLKTHFYRVPENIIKHFSTVLLIHIFKTKSLQIDLFGYICRVFSFTTLGKSVWNTVNTVRDIFLPLNIPAIGQIWVRFSLMASMSWYLVKP